jgi:basic membrane lipoprotein Med (substrate-binding protein (PBP1-ABC) superfamily)
MGVDGRSLVKRIKHLSTLGILNVKFTEETNAGTALAVSAAGTDMEAIKKVDPEVYEVIETLIANTDPKGPGLMPLKDGRVTMVEEDTNIMPLAMERSIETAWVLDQVKDDTTASRLAWELRKWVKDNEQRQRDEIKRDINRAFGRKLV